LNRPARRAHRSIAVTTGSAGPATEAHGPDQELVLGWTHRTNLRRFLTPRPAHGRARMRAPLRRRVCSPAVLAMMRHLTPVIALCASIASLPIAAAATPARAPHATLEATRGPAASDPFWRAG